MLGKHVKYFVLSLGLIFSASISSGATEPTEQIFRLGAGDKISVTVQDHNQLSTTVRIPRSGRIMLPGAGTVHAEGKSLEELSIEVARLLSTRERIRDARVQIELLSYAVRTVYIYGAVMKPRSVSMPVDMDLTLMQAITSCGGFAPPANRANIILRRRNTGGSYTNRTIDITKSKANNTLDPILAAGDIIQVTSNEPVYILGQVKNQGALNIPFEYPLTLSRAIALSGGFTQYARSKSVRVTRKELNTAKSVVVDVNRILCGDLKADMELQPGDIVYIPERVF